MVALVIGILISVISVANFIFFIMVLIKQFSKGGILQGLLGLITFGLYTFIWGWIKHRRYHLTKIMAIWSIGSAISVAIMVVYGTAVTLEVVNQLGLAKGGLKTRVQQKKPLGTSLRKPVPRPAEPVAGRARVTQSVKNTAGGAAGGIDSDNLASAAMALWQSGRYADPDRAVAHWSNVIKARPDSAEAFNNRGLGHYDAGRYLQAIGDYDQAIGLKSDYAIAFNNRGNAYYQLSQFQKALEDFSTSLRLDPAYANAHLNRGLAHYRLKELPPACQDFQKACELGACEMLKWAMSTGVCK